MYRWLCIALLVATSSVPLAAAQIHTRLQGGFARGIGSHHGTHRFARRIYPGSPYFYSDYDSSQPYLTPSDAEDADNSLDGFRPQILLVQPAATLDSSRSAKSRPLLIERQGDRYVRFGGIRETGEGGASPLSEYSASAITKPLPTTQKERLGAQPAELPPAILVYRDGQREEIANYAIANGAIYLSDNNFGGSSLQNDHGSRRIPLAALDLPATVQANRERGAKFMLPSAANVVIASF